MKKIISAIVGFGLFCGAHSAFAQGYEFVKKFENRTITSASSKGSFMVLGRLIKKDIRGNDYLVGASSLYDTFKGKEITLPDNAEAEFGKGWVREIFAVNEQGQYLSRVVNFDALEEYFQITTVEGKTRTILKHQYEDLWSTHGLNFKMNDSGQVLIKITETGDSLKSGQIEHYALSDLYFFDGKNTRNIDRQPRKAAFCPEGYGPRNPDETSDEEIRQRLIAYQKCLQKLEREEIVSFALNESGSIAYSKWEPDKSEYFVREVDGAVQPIDIPGLDAESFVQDFSGSKVMFWGKSGAAVYDLQSKSLQQLYPSSSSLTAIPAYIGFGTDGYDGNQALFQAYRKIGERPFPSEFGFTSDGKMDVNQVFLGLAELGKERTYINCPFPSQYQEFMVMAPQPDGKSFLVSRPGPAASKMDTYEVRLATGASEATPCEVYQGEEAVATALKGLKSMKQSKAAKKLKLARAKRAEMRKKHTKNPKKTKRAHVR